MKEMAYVGYREWKKWSPETFGKVDLATSRYFQVELSRCGLSSLAGQAVLEMGFGNGAFAAWVIAQGARFVGIEMIPALVEIAQNQGIDAHLSADNLTVLVAPGSLDLVAAFDVFEHFALTDLKKTLIEIRDSLRIGGQLIARVPSGDSPFSRSIQHGDFTHQITFGSSAIRQLAVDAGFEVVTVRSPAFPLWGLGLVSCLRRTSIAASRAAVFPLITNLFMGGGSPVLTPNLFFVLRKL